MEDKKNSMLDIFHCLTFYVLSVLRLRVFENRVPRRIFVPKRDLWRSRRWARRK
jgi:hypothetical protein